MDPNIKTIIKSLISKGETEKALKMFAQYDKYNGVQLQGRYSTGKKQHNLGLIDIQGWGVIISQINKSLLDTIEEGEDEQHIDVATNKAKEYYKKGIRYIEDKDYKNAFSAFNDAILEDDKYAKAYGSRGFVRIELEEYREAIIDYERAVQLDPELWLTLHSLGILYIANNQKEKGCECLKRAKEKGFSESETMYNKYCK